METCGLDKIRDSGAFWTLKTSFLCNFIETTLGHGCSPVNFQEHFVLRTPLNGCFWNILSALAKYQFSIVFNLQILNVSNTKRLNHFLWKLALGLLSLTYKYWIILFELILQISRFFKHKLDSDAQWYKNIFTFVGYLNVRFLIPRLFIIYYSWLVDCSRIYKL